MHEVIMCPAHYEESWNTSDLGPHPDA